MSCCAKRQHACDDAILDRLNGVDNNQSAGRWGSGCWQERQRSCCDYCWLWSRCPYHRNDKDRD